MKRVIFLAAILFGLTTFATAQTTTGSGSTTTGASSNTTKAKKGKKAKPSERLNNRRTYKFKNGQRSTPTGNEATGVGGGYAALGQNNATEAKSDTVGGTTVKTSSIGPKPKKTGIRTKRKQ